MWSDRKGIQVPWSAPLSLDLKIVMPYSHTRHQLGLAFIRRDSFIKIHPLTALSVTAIEIVSHSRYICERYLVQTYLIVA